MFLNGLNREEKEAFLELAHLVANVDGVLSTEEEQLISTYAKEMEIPVVALDDSFLKNLSDLMAVFKSDVSRRIVFVELLALTVSDGDYSSEEKDIVNQIRTGFGLNEDQYERYKEWILRVNEIYSEGHTMIYE